MDPDETFSSIHEALGSYDEKAGPKNLPDYDDDGSTPGQGDQGQPPQSDRTSQDEAQHTGSEQAPVEDHDELDDLLATLEPEGDLGEGEDGDGQGDPNQPQALAEDTVLKLPDGSTKRYGDVLKEATEITTHRQQLDADRGLFEQARSQVRQQYETVQAQLPIMAEIAAALIPQEPDPTVMQPEHYNILRAAYEKQVAIINQIVGMHQQNTQQLTASQAQGLENLRSQEAHKLVQRDPRFGDNEFWNGFQKDMFSIGPRVYGYSADELREGMIDHRQFEVLRDAIAYQKIKAAIAKRKGADKHADARQRGAAAAQARDMSSGRYVPTPQGRVVTGSGARGRVDPKAMQRQADEAAFAKNPTLKNAAKLVS